MLQRDQRPEVLQAHAGQRKVGHHIAFHRVFALAGELWIQLAQLGQDPFHLFGRGQLLHSLDKVASIAGVRESDAGGGCRSAISALRVGNAQRRQQGDQSGKHVDAARVSRR